MRCFSVAGIVVGFQWWWYPQAKDERDSRHKKVSSLDHVRLTLSLILFEHRVEA